MRPRTVVRVIDLPRSIVWEGLIDPVLVEGWFDPVLRLVDAQPEVVVIERSDPQALHVEANRLGAIVIRADELKGGTRGTSTRLTVTSELPDWEERLDRLENLLRGHPTDWRSVPVVRRAAN